jgi:aspartate aminotransferase
MSSISIGDRVVILDPSWPVYHRCVEQLGGRVITLHTSVEENWKLDIVNVENALDGAKVLILNNPCNPTGRIIPPKDMKKIAKIANEKGVTIISDEVYSAFTYSPFRSILEFLDSNFIYVDSFSKKFGMTGWRVGYAISDTKTISSMQKIIQSSITCIPGFVQKAALEALKSTKEIYLDYAKKIGRRIDIACKELDGLPLTYMRPNGAMYIFPRIDIEDINSKDFALKLLSEKKVALTPGEAFGDYPTHFRISLTTNEMNIKKGIRSVGDMLMSGLNR